MNPNQRRLIIVAALSLIGIIFLVYSNPFHWNSAGKRTVVEQMSGNQFVRFKPGIYYGGFFAKIDEYPNQISVSYQQKEASEDIEDNAIEIGLIEIRFGVDATKASVSGIAQFFMPTDEGEMIKLHNAHRTLISLVSKRIAPYTKECLKSAAQLMSSEMHYSGGRSQLAQDYIDQLNNGTYLLRTNETFVYDSVSLERKKIYKIEIRYDKSGLPARKFSSLKEYGIAVADAQITDVDYEPLVDNMLSKKIASSTNASIAKQELITAQQKALTAKAQGEQKLVEIEYEKKQEQTKQVVAAQTLVLLAEQDKQKQKIAQEAAEFEGKKIKILADAEAYKKRAVIQANGALEQKLGAWVEERKAAWAAFAEFKGSIVPTYQSGTGQSNAMNWMEIMGMQAAKNLTLDMKTE